MKYLVCKFGDDCFMVNTFALFDDKESAIQDAKSIGHGKVQNTFKNLPMNKGKILRVSVNKFGDLCVSEVFEIKDDTKWCMVRHHGFDGIDFSCAQFLDKATALAAMEESISDYVEFDVNEEEYDGSDSWCIDDGNEWLYWDVLEIKEG